MESSREKCTNCNETFNLGSREPLIMSCCGGSICKKCIEDLKRPKIQDYICPFNACQQQNASEQKITPNGDLKNILEKNRAVNIYCSEHLNVKADFYCKTHQAMICTNCAFQNHADHHQQFVSLINQEFQTYCSVVQSKLQIEIQRLVSIAENFTKYHEKDHIFSAEEFISLAKSSHEAIAQQTFNEEEHKALSILGYNMFEESKVEIKSTTDTIRDEIDNLDLQPQAFNLPNLDSNIISFQDLSLITEWLDNPQIAKFQLLFRGSTHGFTAAAFHQHCDNQGPTLTIVKSIHDKIFGSYCSISWQSGDNVQQPDDKAFIFSITQKTKHEQFQHQEQAVRHHSKYLAAFGNDFLIGDNCNKVKSSFSNIGYTYKPSGGIQYGSKEAKAYLGGNMSFRVEEIETFRVIMN